MTKSIPVELLRRVLRYEADTGRLYWLPRTPDLFRDGRHTAEHTCNKWNSKNAGKEAFTANNDGRKEGRIFGVCYRAHRVAWALHHGRWPDGEIDHINHDASDNRIANLRDCTHAENLANSSSTKGSTSRFLGVSWSKKSAKWSAIISPNGKTIALGRFASEIEAAKAYDDAARKHFGEFANLNFPEPVA